MGAPFWSDGAVAKLREFRESGMTFSAVSIAMSREGFDFTRNACIGKAKRIGMLIVEVKRPAPVQKPREVRTEGHMNGALAFKVSRAIRAKQLLEEAPPQELPKTELVEGFRHLSLFDLDETTCRWPHGDGPSVTFCGLHPEGDFPYCIHHCRIAYKAPDKRDRGTNTNHSSTGQLA